MAINRYSVDRGHLRKDYVTGSSAIALSVSIIKPTKVIGLTLHLSAAPSTGENFEIKLNANVGTAYDAVLHSVDLSTGSTTDLIWYPDGDLFLETGDALDISYPNTDAGTYGLQVTTKELT